FLALYLSSRGIDARQTGLVLSLLGVGAVLAGPTGGQLADHAGRKPALLLALAFSAVSALYLGFVRSPLAIAPGVLSFGLGVSMARPAMQAIVADVLPPELLGRAYALLSWAANVGIAVSAWIGGVLAGRTWLGLFAGDAITTVLFAALVVFRVPESRPTPASEARAVGWSTLAGDRPFSRLPRHPLRLHDRVLAIPVRASARRGAQRLRDGGVRAHDGAELRGRVRHAALHRALVARDRPRRAAGDCLGVGRPGIRRVRAQLHHAAVLRGHADLDDRRRRWTAAGERGRGLDEPGGPPRAIPGRADARAGAGHGGSSARRRRRGRRLGTARALGGVRRRGLCGGRRARRAGSGTPEARGARRLTTTSSPRAGTQPFPRSARTGRAPPRCAGAGCTSPSGRCGSQTRS